MELPPEIHFLWTCEEVAKATSEAQQREEKRKKDEERQRQKDKFLSDCGIFLNKINK